MDKLQAAKYIPYLLLLFSINAYAGLSFNDYFNISGSENYNRDNDTKVQMNFRADNRLISSYLVDPTSESVGFKFEAHLLSSYSRAPNNAISLPTTLVIRDDRTNLLNMYHSRQFNQNSTYGDSITNKIDRLYFSIFNNNYEITAGRTTITWSRARMFHVSDFFNPQIPGFYDGDYKIGTDMVYVNYSLDANSNVSLVANPRRNYETEDISMEDTTFAWRYFHSNQTSDYSFGIAQYLQDYILSAGFSTDFIWGAVLRFDSSFISPEYNRDNFHPMTMLGVEKSDYFFDYSTTLFMEYFHNELGRKNNHAPISNTMQKRLQNQDIFILGKDYLSLGAMVELTPYTNLNYSNIISLKDASLFNLLALTYSYSQSLDLGLSYIQAVGRRGDEFGRNCVGNTCSSMGASLMLSANYSF
jgi:hypothetical protein